MQKQIGEEMIDLSRLPNHSPSLRKLRTGTPAGEEVGRVEEDLQPFCVLSQFASIKQNYQSTRYLSHASYY